MVMYRSDVKLIVVKGYSNDKQCWKAFNIFKVWVQRCNEVKNSCASPDKKNLQVYKSRLEVL